MNNKYFEMYSKRINNLNVIIIFISLYILFNFFYLQIFDHPELSNQINKDSIKTKTSIGERGKILDRNKNELAITTNKYDFWVNTYKKYDKEKIVSLFSEVFNRDKNFYSNELKKQSNYLIIEKNVSDEEAYFILNEIKKIKGLRYNKRSNRFYKYDEFGSQVIGYVDNSGNGIIGIEGELNNILNGDTVKIKLKKGAKGKYYEEDFLNTHNLSGYDIDLTIDINLQKILQEELRRAVIENNSISANGLIVNPKNGEILAMASIPDFNPNYYNEFPIESFNNAVISNSYEPGSTFKILPYALILNNDLYDTNDSIFCENGVYKLSNNKLMHDHEENGMLSFEEILIHSSNIGISKLSDFYDSKSFFKIIKKFGFGNQTNIPLNNESSGKIRVLNQWSQTSKNYLSIGQELSITNLQLAMAYSAIANGGYLLKPSIIKKIYKNDKVIYENKNKIIRRVVDENISEMILEMLGQVVSRGTATSIDLAGYDIAGKTGTAQKYKNGHLNNYIATFASIFPSTNPDYVMIISIDEPEYGKHWANLSAVPSSREVIKRILIQNDYAHGKIAKNIDKIIKIKNEVVENTLSNDTKFLKNRFPNLKGKTLKEALKIAKEMNFILEPSSSSGRIVKQSIKHGVKIDGDVICKVQLN
ncbi:MAG: hypothetical protein CMG61_04890 [Candidatus Marinimicrobia bacterium]|nr:hypothetical protein [Candidatus Neomarinimicrobiota bacterium]